MLRKKRSGTARPIIHKAMEKLSPQQKWLIGQSYYESRTRTEIAAELGVGESAIRNRLKKIYEKLKKS